MRGRAARTASDISSGLAVAWRMTPTEIAGTPFFVIFGTLSDKIGRKPIIMAGCLLAVLTYFPLFKALTVAANPALARSIEHIAVAARGESAAATRIADTMLSIRQFAMQTSDSAGQTSQAVADLNGLSGQLRASVAGFKLPPG